jgi:signal recognition particle receptor subunit beta
MASYDQERSCLVVRIVFDGPALAGKTTNLKQLCELFPIEKRSEMYTPGSLKGRTMFFDWLEIDGGRKTQQSFRFQLLTVPGQVQRNYRRRPLIEMADVVVFVCDCDPEQLDETKRSFNTLRTHLKKRLPRKVPLVVQANKQDHPEALTPTEIREILKLDEWVPIITAVASAGDGVKDTITSAMRMAMKEAQQQMNDGVLMQGAMGASASTADDLFMAMLELEDGGEEENDPGSIPPASPSTDPDSALSSLDNLDGRGSNSDPPMTVAYEVSPPEFEPASLPDRNNLDDEPPHTVLGLGGVGGAADVEHVPMVEPIYYQEPTTRPAPPPDESVHGEFELDVHVEVEVDPSDEPTKPLPPKEPSGPRRRKS